jgi:hypothetical protein
MIAALIVFILWFLLIPSVAFAWGPLTHIYLGSEIYYFSTVLPAAVYGLLKKYKEDYLYGNLVADIILAKKYMPLKKNSHNWDVALSLYESSETDTEKAFCLGYMSHLAADTVAHGKYTAGRKVFQHTMLELRADSLIDRSYWFKAVAIDRKVQFRNDAFLEKSLERAIFSFKTNKRIFKGVVALSCLNTEVPFTDLLYRSLSHGRVDARLKGLHDESLSRIVDVLQNGKASEVLKKDPIAHHGKLARARVLTAIAK